MNDQQLYNALQAQLKNAEQAKKLNQKTPMPRPKRDPTIETVQWQMKSVQASMQKQNIGRDHVQCIVVTDDPHISKTPIGKLKPIYLNEMQVPKVHKGRYLVCQVTTNPIATLSTHALVKDLTGDVEMLYIYNYSYDVRNKSWLSVGTIVVVKEPFMRFGTGDKAVSLRVDSPSDLVFVDPSDLEFLKQIGAEKWFVPSTTDINQIKEQGNKCFQRKEYEAATFLYNRAIRLSPDTPVLYLNKCSSQLRSGYFDGAYESAKIGLEQGDDREKALYRYI